MKTVPIFSTLLLTITFSECSKILGIFPMTSRSHHILGNALMQELAEKGHDVTIITPFKEKKLPKNGTYREIILADMLEEDQKRRKNFNMLEFGEMNIFVFLPFIVQTTLNMTENTLIDPGVQNLLKSDEKFDVVIVEQFLNEAHKGFASHFDAPMVLLSTVGAYTWVNMVVGNPAPPSYIPDIFQSYSSRMTFCERVVNTIMYLYNTFLYELYAFPKQRVLYNKYFPDGPEFYDTLYNASVILLNSHPSTNQPVPYVPNMIDIGGFHVQPSKKLPEDLQKFLDEAKEGVVYFSMGSNVRSSQFPPEKRDAFLRAFSKLKQKVLWKWEEDVLPGQPKNVKLGKWLPQQEILAHPNVKLFITHGGLLSTTETIYHGVPALAIPIAADQKLNAQKIENEGFGLVLRYKEISEKVLTEKLQELLSNPKYAQNAKKRSEIFHDRPTKPMDTAIYWVEYVIRHGGAPHLRVAGLDLPWYQYMLLDVIVVILVVLGIGAYLFCKSLKFVFSLCSKRKSQKVKKS